MDRIGFIGMGSMAQAMVEGLVGKGGYPAEKLYAYAPHREKLEKNGARLGFTCCQSNQELVEQVDTVILAVKPHQIEAVLAPLREGLKGKVLLSVAAGWGYERLREQVDETTRILAIMPNTPLLVGEGVLLLEESNSLTPEELEQVKELFAPLGVVSTLPTERMSIGGTVAACSPAFFAMAVEALADAAVLYGIPRDQAYPLISQAMAGTGKLLLETGMHPGQLKDMVCSPNGTTIQGVSELEKSGFRAALLAAVERIEGA